MRSIILAAAVGLVALVVGASPVAASPLTCKPDKVGNWEVKLGHETTAKRAAALKARAVAKRLNATLESDGCGKRWEVMIAASNKTRAKAIQATARKDGFKVAVLEKS